MHTHLLLFGSKFHIILAMYVQMLDKYIENIKNIKNIENIENIENMGYFRYFRYFRKYHDIFQPCLSREHSVSRREWGGRETAACTKQHRLKRYLVDGSGGRGENPRPAVSKRSAITPT